MTFTVNGNFRDIKEGNEQNTKFKNQSLII